jgi:hypothetical protein
VIETAPNLVDLPAALPDGRPGPVLRRVSSSSRGGWPLFCRLLLWSTRHAK